MNVLFVCSGNLCRSPLAEAVLKRRLERGGPEAVTAASAGTLGIEGEPAHDATAEAAAFRGYDLSSHRSRALTAAAAGGADLILCMERWHVDCVRALSPSHTDVRLITELLPKTDPRRGEDVPDPIGAGADEQAACLDLLEACVEGLLDALRAGRPGEAPRASGEDRAETRYFAAIGEKLAAARGGSPGITSMEFHVVDRWWQRHVPLWLVLEALDAVGALWPPGEAPRSLLRRCEAEVARRLSEAALPDWRERRSESVPKPPDLQTLRVAAIQFLETALARTGRSNERVRLALKSALESLRSGASNPVHVVQSLDSIREDVLRAAYSDMSTEEASDLRAHEERRLRQLAPWLPEEEVGRTVDQLIRARLLDQLGLAEFTAESLGWCRGGEA